MKTYAQLMENKFLKSDTFDRMGSEFDLVLSKSNISQSGYDKAWMEWMEVSNEKDAKALLKKYS